MSHPGYGALAAVGTCFPSGATAIVPTLCVRDRPDQLLPGDCEESKEASILISLSFLFHARVRILFLKSFEAAPRRQSHLPRDVLIEGSKIALSRTGTSGLSRRRNKAEQPSCNDPSCGRLESDRGGLWQFSLPSCCSRSARASCLPPGGLPSRSRLPSITNSCKCPSFSSRRRCLPMQLRCPTTRSSSAWRREAEAGLTSCERSIPPNATSSTTCLAASPSRLRTAT